jgi:hypothetical protein
VRTFDPDAFDAFDDDERPGGQMLPWEMWERERPWRAEPADDHAPVAEVASHAVSDMDVTRSPVE